MATLLKDDVGRATKYGSWPQELIIVDRLCERWARWAGWRKGLPGVGWPTITMLGKKIRTGVAHESLSPSAGNDKPPDGVILVDGAVAKLPPQLQRCIHVEYFSDAPCEAKARLLELSRIAFRERLRSAQWALHVRLEAELELHDLLPHLAQ